jgi:hypothetical protein
MLHGAVCRPIEQSLENGEPTGKRVLRTEQEVKWERISCVRCGAQCERIDERIPRLQEQIENLELELAFATGRLVPENRLPC